MSEEQKPEKKIVIDNDWKEQVRQEKDRLATDSPDEPAQSEEAVPGGTAESHGQLPPADFGFLISMMATQAFAAMGQIPDPSSGQVNKQLEVAKHMINLLAMLEEKTKGNLTAEERAGLENILHQLRMAYVASGQRS